MKNTIGLLRRPSKWLAGSVAWLFVAGMFLPAAIIPMAVQEAGAQWTTPTVGADQLSPREAPCISYEVGPATGTSSASIVTGTTASPSKGWVNWVSVSTGSFGSYLVLRDTGSFSNTGINTLTGRIHYSSAAATALDSGLSYLETQVVRYDPPVQFTRGLAVQANGCTGGCFAVVCYRVGTRQTP